jgi:autonomous glycyl radical cofactor GrcA
MQVHCAINSEISLEFWLVDSEQIERSLLVTGFGYEHDEAWATNIALFKEFTDTSRVRSLHSYHLYL